MMWTQRFVLFALVSAGNCLGFVVPLDRKLMVRTTSTFLRLSAEPSLEQEVRSMRVKEIKLELKSRNIGTADVFEKEELVQRLLEARRQQPQEASKSTTTATPSSSNDAIRVPLTFYSMESGTSVTTKNSANVFLRPSPNQFATLQLQVPSSRLSNKYLSLLVDTACSGVVLRPSTVRSHGFRRVNAPVSMMSAGGTNGASGVTQLDRVVLDGNNSFGPLLAAVQDIGALPLALDGIIGLSFLNQFACVELDFGNGLLNLYMTDSNPLVSSSLELPVMAQADMKLTRLGIWTVDVTLDGRGPVAMLVDTGAGSSFLNWKGVQDLGLSRTSSPQISAISNPTGAMGADNIALALTHRYTVQRRYNLAGGGGASATGPGISLHTPTNVDIGNLPVLNNLPGVGGILGADLLMQCGVARMAFRGSRPKLTLYSNGK